MVTMVVEDLQQIIGDARFRISSKRNYIIAFLIGLVIIIALLSMIVGLIYMGATKCGGGGSPRSSGQSGGGGSQTCMTSTCLQAASKMMEKLNTKEKPCDNFYKYSCGGWIKNTGIPPNYGHMDIMSQMALANEEKWREILESPIHRNSQDSSERKLKEFFKMCLHDYGRMKDSGKILIDMIRTDLGGWYVLGADNWSGSWNLETVLAKAHIEYLAPVLFDYGVWPDTRDPEKSIITIFPAYLGLPTYDYNNTQRQHVVEYYKTFIRTIGGLLLRDANVSLSDDVKQQRLDQFVDDVFQQEKHLAQLKKASDRSWRATVTTLGEMNTNFTQINWVNIFGQVFSNAGISGSTHVAVRKIDFFKHLDETLAAESTDRNRMLNNYIVWTVVKLYASYLSWEYRYAKYQFLEARSGMTEFPNTWESCLYLAKTRLGYIMAAQFIQQHIGLDTKSELKKMSNEMLSALKGSVDNVSWMDGPTKTTAKQKLSDLKEFVGYPDFMGDQAKMDQMYSTLNINKTLGFFRNLVNLNEHIRYIASKELTSPYKSALWRYAVLHDGFGVEPLYYWFYNTILIPPGAMRLPMYSTKTPMVLNYGAMGSSMASKFVHAVDKVGRWVINSTFINWWTANTTDGYDLKRQCFENYYSGLEAGPYLVEGINRTVSLDADTSLLRVIARTSGLHIAYKAYKDWSTTNHDLSLPGLNMTTSQLFFLATAQTHCFVQRDEEAYDWALSGYLPEDVMVNGMMAMTKEFAEAFNCPNNSKLKPKEQCLMF